MTARRVDRDPVVPELTLGDLAEATELESGARNELIRISGGLAAGRDLVGTTFLEVHWDGAALDGTTLVDARFVECRFSALDAAGFDAPGSTWRHVELLASRIGAAELDGADLHAVRIDGCRFGYVNLRRATCRDLVVSGCHITDLDLGAASVQRARFEDCRIGHLMLSAASLHAVDLRGAQIDTISGVAGLAGALIDEVQLAALAPALAGHLGIEVE
jgi:uncharacterized protein YjbI with pentapeptide repeats